MGSSPKVGGHFIYEMADKNKSTYLFRKIIRKAFALVRKVKCPLGMSNIFASSYVSLMFEFTQLSWENDTKRSPNTLNIDKDKEEL